MIKFLHREPETLFDGCGRLLFGDFFFAELLSRELGVTKRITERWASGAKPVPPFVWPKVKQLLREKAHLLNELAAGLDQRIEREREKEDAE